MKKLRENRGRKWGKSEGKSSAQNPYLNTINMKSYLKKTNNFRRKVKNLRGKVKNFRGKVGKNWRKIEGNWKKTARKLREKS